VDEANLRALNKALQNINTAFAVVERWAQDIRQYIQRTLQPDATA
jgi:hypothetical protein